MVLRMYQSRTTKTRVPKLISYVPKSSCTETVHPFVLKLSCTNSDLTHLIWLFAVVTSMRRPLTISIFIYYSCKQHGAEVLSGHISKSVSVCGHVSNVIPSKRPCLTCTPSKWHISQFGPCSVLLSWRSSRTPKVHGSWSFTTADDCLQLDWKPSSVAGYAVICAPTIRSR